MADKQQQSQRQKLPKLPKNTKVTKRPLLHPTIPSKYAGSNQQKVIYIGTRTPFMSAVKRVERHLDQVEKRATQSATAHVKNENKKKRKYGQYSAATGDDDAGEIGRIAKKLAEKDAGEEGSWMKEEVVLKASGRAIEKALKLALYFTKKEGFGVLIKTGSVGAIDDIEVEEPEDTNADAEGRDGDDQTMKDATATDKETQEAIPETRIRYASTIDVAVYKT
ncbi:Rpp20 subunit of nuclear RNase MRP and P-domain-containing protein [Delphinella strobiligena]|nr:Rpp20 subunit of nuclear RNase MRP and P-domain-containing protein [Delphinella strobiligena]